MEKVTIYSTPTCQFCLMAKEFFKKNNVEFTDYNVAENDAKREEMIQKTGQMGVPVIVVGEGDGEKIVIGFDQPKLKELLGLA